MDGRVGRLLHELRRRKVISVLAAYAVGVYAAVAGADLFVPILTLPDWIPTLLLVTALALTPVIASLSWFFEFTPDGLVRTVRTATEQAEREPLSVLNWLGLLVIGVAAITAGALLFDQIRARQAGERPVPAVAQQKSVAVMVFRDLSPEQDLGYLAEGLAEDLTAALGRTSGLEVIATSSTRRFLGRSDSPAAIGRALGAATLLDGSVRLDGSRLLITASLIDADSGRTRWSERFSRPLEEVFELQEQIALSMLNRIIDNYVTPEGARLSSQATSADAYVMYLRGRQQFRERTPESIRQARRYFEQALALDNEYAPAYVGVADSVRLLARGTENYGDLDPAIAADLARRNLERALLRDPGLPQAYAALGHLAAMRGSNEEALAAYDKAIELNPSYAEAWHWRFLALRDMARNVDALASLETALRLDPLSPVILRNWGVEQFRRGESATALAVFDQLIELDPQSPVGYRAAAQVAFSGGALQRSTQYYQEVLKRSPDTDQYRAALGEIYMMLGMVDAAATVLDPDVYAVNLLIAAGEYERALEMIRTAHAGDPDDPLLSFEHAWYELLWGERERGREILRALDATILGTGWFDRNFCSPHIEMAYGFPDGPDRERWLGVCRSYVAEQLAAGYASSELAYLSARVAVLDGDLARAREALIDAVARGWRQPWTAQDPLLAPIIAAPQVQEALQRIANELAREKAALEQRI